MRVFVPVKAMQEVEVGETIVSLASGLSYVVVHHMGSHVIAVRTIDASNPSEWNVYKEIKK